MIGHIFDASFATAREALTGLSRRQTAIAANVANIDTPGYQRREVTFEDALREQVGMTVNPLRATDPRHFTSARSTAMADGPSTRPRDVVGERNDLNNVSVDEEMVLLVDTQLRFQALAQTTGKRIATLRTVIRGQ